MSTPSTSSTTSSQVPILTVSQLTHAIKLCLESTFPSVWLQGEISNCKLQSSGHLYFSLKDANAQISAVMFRGDVSALRVTPKDGDNVMVRGEVNVYPASGKYQLIIRELKHVGLGELLLKLVELKVKILKKAWLKSDHKKPLPKFPKRIGVVTSPTGAVIQDILNILTRRFSGFHLILNPVRVQGDGAAQEIAQAINQFNQYQMVDVLIVGRGGGSIEDLWAFNEEIVAEAIYHSQIPIISAVGHETDHCIADYVADVRAPTPSAAAELVIADKAQQLGQLDHIKRRLQQTLSHLIRQRRHQLEGIRKQPVIQSPYSLLGPWMQKLDDLRQDTDLSLKQSLARKRLLLEGRHRQLQALRPSAQIAHFRQKLLQWDSALRHAMAMRLLNYNKILEQRSGSLIQAWQNKQEHRRRMFDPTLKKKQLDQQWQPILNLRKERLVQLCAALHSINPKNLLTKGYCILFSEKEHSVITSIKAVEKQQDVRVLLSDGEILSTIKDVFPSESTKSKTRTRSGS